MNLKATWKSPILRGTLAGAWGVAACALFFSHCWVSWHYALDAFDLSYLRPVEWAARLRAWARLIQGPAVALFASAVLLHWGGRLRRVLGLPDMDPALRVAMDFALGALALDLFWMGAGFTGLWRGPLVAVFAAAFALPLLGDLARHARASGTGREDRPLFSWREHGWAGNLVMGAGLLYLLLAFIHSVVPDLFYDSESYHLAFLSLWKHLGGFVPVPGHLFAQYPYNGELVFMNGFWFGSDEAAKGINVAVLAAAGLAFYGWAREEAGAAAAAFACGALWSFPIISVNVWNTRVEGLLALFTTLCLYAAFRSSGEQEGSRRDAFFLAACLLGALALSVKYVAVLYLGSFAVAWWWTLGRGKERFLPTKAAWMAFLAASALLVPWVLRNAVWTGNPFAPYLTRLLGGDTLSAFGRTTLILEQQHFVSTEFWGFVTWPIERMTHLLDAADFTGVFALVFLPLAAFLPAPSDRWRVVSRTWILSFVVGSLVTHILRFHAPTLILGYLVGAVFWTRVGGKAWVLRAASVAAVVSALLAVPTLLNLSRMHYSPWGLWLGAEDRSAYIARVQKTTYEPLAEAVARGTAPGDRILVVGDARTLHYPRAAFAQSVFDLQLPVQWVTDDPSPEAVWRGLKRLGVDAVAVSGREAARRGFDYDLFPLSADDWRRLDRGFRSAVLPVEVDRWDGLYRLRPAFDPSCAWPAGGPRPFQLLSPPGAGFVKAYQHGAWRTAGRMLTAQIGFFPQEPYWWEQRARVRLHLKDEKGALDDLRSAARLGPLHESSLALLRSGRNQPAGSGKRPR